MTPSVALSRGLPTLSLMPRMNLKTDMPHLAARVFAQPLAIARPKLDAIMTVLAPRLGVVAPLAEAPSFNAQDRAPVETVDGIAVVQVIGTLVHRASGMEAMSGMSTYGEIAAEIDAALADGNVKGILLEIDSPGGEVAGLFDLVSKVQAAAKQKPCYAIANAMACSAAYAIGAAADVLFVAKTGDVGSVGVVALHVDQSAFDQKEGLKFTYVHAGAKKVDGNPHEALSPRAHADLQADIDKVYEIFVKQVSEARRLSQRDVRATEAATFMGEAAVAAGLADQVGALEDAKAALRAEINRRSKMDFQAKVAMKLALAETASESEVLAELDASGKAHGEALARADSAEKELAESESAVALLAGQVEKLQAEVAAKGADHAIELAKTRALEAGLPPMDKDVEEDARALFALGKTDLAKRTLDRHLESARSKVTALRDPRVRVQKDEESKGSTSVLEKAKANAAELLASRKTKRGTAAK